MNCYGIINKLKIIFVNKVILYLLTRYLTYFIQFITSIFIAVKLGPYYFGIWGFLLLLINYFQITNFGISNSLNVLMVQYKSEPQKIKNFVASSLFIVGVICGLVTLIALYYYKIGIPLFDKYQLGRLFYMVCLIAILNYINTLFMTIYRVKNSLFYVAFYQSIIPLSVFVLMFIEKGENLLYLLLMAYLISHLLSFFLFIKGRKIPFGGEINKEDIKIIFNKGIFLFIYNLCYYLIIISTKSFVSAYYLIEEFGYFTFCYTLAYSILLFLEALSFVIFPKIIDKLKSQEYTEIEKVLERLRINYISLAHGLMYLALIIFPLILSYIPHYSGVGKMLSLIALTVLLYTNSFGFSTFIIAQNKEKYIARISFVSLIINISIVYTFIVFLNFDYQYVILGTMITYLLYTLQCVYRGCKILNQKKSFLMIFNSAFPLRLFLPYVIALFIILFDLTLFIIFPLVIFFVLNLKELRLIYMTIKQIVYNPSVIDV